MSLILGLYRKLVPDQIRRAYNEELQKIRREYKNKCAMHRRRYGTLNRDKTFYVIRSEWPQSWGIATTACIVFNNIKYAVERGGYRWLIISAVICQVFRTKRSKEEKMRGSITLSSLFQAILWRIDTPYFDMTAKYI